MPLALIRADREVALAEYLLHFIQSSFGKAALYKRTLVNAVPKKINLGEIGKLLIPIPCPDDPEKSLAIQREIVRILDNFTELTTELTAELTDELTDELTARKKQYNYYRDQLLTPSDSELEWKDLGWVGQVSCLLYTSPSPRDRTRSRMPSSA